MIQCLVFKGNQPSYSCTWEALQSAPLAASSFVYAWVENPNALELNQLQQAFNLHELAIEDVNSAKQRAKLEHYEDTLFLVLRSANLLNDKLHLGEVHIFLSPRFLVVIDQNSGLAKLDVHKRLKQLPKKIKATPASLAYIIFDQMVDKCTDVLEQLRERFEDLEEVMFTETLSHQSFEKSYHLKRELLLFSSAIEPLDDIFDSLMHLYTDQVPKPLMVYLRDVQDHSVRLTKTAATLREMLVTAMQVNLALASINQNDTSKKLTGWAAIFAIPTVIFGLYGMNFQFMPELQWRYSYFAVLGGTGSVCLFVYLKLKKKNWL